MIRSSLIEHGKRTSLMSVLLAMLLALAYAPLARFYRNRWEGWILTLGWVLVGLNVLRAALSHLYKMDRLPFRRFDLALQSDAARPGESFQLEAVCEARRNLGLEGVSTTLECINESLSEKGRTEKLLHHERRVMGEGLNLSPGETRRFAAELAVPAGSPASYKDPERRIRWRISVSARVRDWGELVDQFEVTVEPR